MQTDKLIEAILEWQAKQKDEDELLQDQLTREAEQLAAALQNKDTSLINTDGVDSNDTSIIDINDLNILSENEQVR